MVTGVACAAEVAATVVSGVTAPVIGGAIPVAMGVGAGKTCAAAVTTCGIAGTTAFATQAFSSAQGEGDTGGASEGEKGVKSDKQRNGTPGNNQHQNKQFQDATRGLTKDQKRRVHDEISGQDYSYKEIKDLVKEMFGK